MLVLSRKLDEGVQIGEGVTIKVLGIKGNQVRLGIEAPKDVKVNRAELFEDEETAADETSSTV